MNEQRALVALAESALALPSFQYDLTEYKFDRITRENIDDLAMQVLGRLAVQEPDYDVVVWHGAWSIQRHEMPVMVARVDRPYFDKPDSTAWYFGMAPRPTKSSQVHTIYFVDYACHPAESMQRAVEGLKLFSDTQGRYWKNDVAG